MEMPLLSIISRKIVIIEDTAVESSLCSDDNWKNALSLRFFVAASQQSEQAIIIAVDVLLFSPPAAADQLMQIGWKFFS